MSQAVKHRTTIEECAAWRERADDGENTETIATETEFSCSAVAKHIRNGEGCSHDTEGETGVAPVSDRNPGDVSLCEKHIASVCEELAKRIRRNVCDVVHVRAGTLDDDVSPSARRIGAVLEELADEEQHGLAAKRSNPNANRAIWMVRFADERGEGQ